MGTSAASTLVQQTQDLRANYHLSTAVNVILQLYPYTWFFRDASSVILKKKKKIGGSLQAQLTIIQNILYAKKTDEKILRTYQFTSTRLFTIFHRVR